MIYKKHLLFFLTIILVFSGCTKIHVHGSKDSFPEKKPRQGKLYFTYGLKSKKAEESGDIYIVKAGDTLFLISLEYDVNYKKIAKWNNIKKPYKIYVGDKIIIKSKKFRKVSSEVAISKAKKFNINWVRPHNGKVIKEYSYSQIGKKGIDIAGNIGDKIFSASDGKVVYTGNGIKGYGNLIIVKHDDVYLTAYAHIDEILVDEKDVVKKGQLIATLGDTDAIKPMLHFQIRKYGKSVNPESFLP